MTAGTFTVHLDDHGEGDPALTIRVEGDRVELQFSGIGGVTTLDPDDAECLGHSFLEAAQKAREGRT